MITMVLVVLVRLLPLLCCQVPTSRHHRQTLRVAYDGSWYGQQAPILSSSVEHESNKYEGGRYHYVQEEGVVVEGMVHHDDDIDTER